MERQAERGTKRARRTLDQRSWIKWVLRVVLAWQFGQFEVSDLAEQIFQILFVLLEFYQNTSGELVHLCFYGWPTRKVLDYSLRYMRVAVQATNCDPCSHRAISLFPQYMRMWGFFR